MNDLNPQEFEDVPKEYADYLRIQVIAMAHRYLVELKNFEEKGSDAAVEPDWDTVEDIAEQTRNLRAWKKVFNIKDID